ncbi:MAG: TolC family protein [Magnetococcales bacterium]|nr:TolC family protein [Magnetococcales bacterium]
MIGKRWVEISLDQARQQAVEKNVTLQGSRLAQKWTSLQVDKAQTFFDTRISATAGYDKSITYERIEQGMKYFSGTTSCAGATGARGTYCREDIANVQIQPAKNAPPTADQPVYRFFSSTVPIAYLRYTENPNTAIDYGQGRPPGEYEHRITASEASLTTPSRSSNYSLVMTKPLPLGMQLTLNQETRRKKSEWVANALADDPLIGSYERPWTSSFGGTLTVPAPGSKWFGTLAQGEVAVEKAVLGDRQSAQEHHVRVNQVLLAVDQAFWSLVMATRTLDIIMVNRQELEQKVAKARTHLEMGRITKYGLAQIEAEWTRVKGREITAWQEYRMASHALGDLLEFDASTLFLPVGYAQAMENPLNMPLDQALEKGQKHNPDRYVQEARLEQARLAERESVQRSRPDVVLTASVTGKQSDAAFGYVSYNRSMIHLFDPDQLTLSWGGSYRYPWLNREARAAMGETEAVRDAAQTRLQQVENQVRRKITTAHIAFDSARERIGIASRHCDLARAALDKAVRMLERGYISDAEWIAKNGEWLEACQGLVLARTAAKVAESTLLAAMGELGRSESGKGGTEP